MAAPGLGPQVHLTPVLRTLGEEEKYLTSTYRAQTGLIFSQMSLGTFNFKFILSSELFGRRWEFLK